MQRSQRFRRKRPISKINVVENCPRLLSSNFDNTEATQYPDRDAPPSASVRNTG